MEILFSVNKYDKDGDVVESGIYLHFNDLFSFKVERVSDLESVINKLKKIKAEIKETYPNLK